MAGTMKEKEQHLMRAPLIVLDHQSGDALNNFLRLTAGLTTEKSHEATAAERQRLLPYFTAMSAYLSQELKKVMAQQKAPAASRSLFKIFKAPVQQYSDQQVAEMEQLVKPASLSALFNAMAGYSRNTLLSDMVIATDDLMNQNGPAQALFKAQQQFQRRYTYHGYHFHVGFLQIQAPAADPLETRSTTLPVFLLDHRLVSCVKDAEPQRMLEALQSVMTTVNHDMLHHLTVPVLNPAIASRHDHMMSRTAYMRLWADQLPPSPYQTEGYEDWAQITHEGILQGDHPVAQKTVAGISAQVDIFFDALERIHQKVGSAEQLDALAMVMAHMLTRAFALDHPVLQQCLDRMEGSTWRLDSEDEPKPAAANTRLAKQARKAEKLYRRAGLALTGKKCRTSYRAQKIRQLISLSAGEVLPHIPDSMRMRDSAAHLSLDMVAAAAKTAGYQPS